MAKIPPKSLLLGDSIKHSAAQGKVAYVYECQEGFRVCMNGECGPCVDAVARGMPIISPDGRHVAAVVKKDGKSRVLLNGQLTKAYDMILGLSFSPDSMKLAYIAADEDGAFVFVNQDRHATHPTIDPRINLVFSPDSNHLAYAAGTENKKVRLVLDETPGPVFDEIRHVTFSPDGRRLVYAAKHAGKWHLVEGDQKSPGYHMIHRVNFSPDSGSMAYTAQTTEGFFVVHNGKKSPLFEVVAGEPIFSNNGKRIAFSVAERTRQGLQMRLFVDHQPGPPYDVIGPYLFSPDSRKVAHIANKEEEQLVVVHGDTEHESYQAVGVPVFDPQSRYLAYPAQDGPQTHMIYNRKKGKGFDAVSSPLFSPSGDRLAYIGNVLLGQVVIIDDLVLGPYLWAGDMAFSPDGKHFVYGAAVLEEDEAAGEDGGAFMVVDGWKGEERFYSFLKGAGLVFIDNNTVQGIAFRELGTEFWLIRATLEEK